MVEILKWPDGILKQISDPIDNPKEVENLVGKLFEVLKAYNGVGLAAPQIGVNLRVFVISSSKTNVILNRCVFINPELKESYGEIEWEEECLSLPNEKIVTKRSSVIKMQAMNLFGNTFTINVDRMLSVLLQHELDHLDGKMILDRKYE